MSKLKSCPHCSGKAEIWTEPCGLDVWWFVGCVDACNATVSAPIESEAVDMWNRRDGM